MVKRKRISFQSFFLGLTLLLFSCGDSTDKKPNIIEIPEDGYNFSIFQRKQVELPSSEGGVYINIDDITRGHANVTLVGNQKLLLESSFSEGDENLLELDGLGYKLTCNSIQNKIIGEDRMDFTLSQVTSSLQPNKVKDEINGLIHLLETADITFIRNGKEHSGKEASAHLRMKLNKSKYDFNTVDEFIEKLASHSSMSGKPYQVVRADGSKVNAKEWFGELKHAR